MRTVYTVRCETCGWIGRRDVSRNTIGRRGAAFETDDLKYGSCPQGHTTMARYNVLEERRIRKAKEDLRANATNE